MFFFCWRDKPTVHDSIFFCVPCFVSPQFLLIIYWFCDQNLWSCIVLLASRCRILSWLQSSSSQWTWKGTWKRLCNKACGERPESTSSRSSDCLVTDLQPTSRVLHRDILTTAKKEHFSMQCLLMTCGILPSTKQTGIMISKPQLIPIIIINK